MRGSVRKRGETWGVVYDEPSSDGRRRQRSKSGFQTKREASKFLTEQLRRLDEGSYAAPAQLTVGTFLTDEGLPAIRPTVRASTVRTYTSMIKHLQPIAGIRLQALRSGHLTALYAE